MKLIVAIIRPELLCAVQSALDQRGLNLTCISQALSGARETGCTEIYRGRVIHVPRPKLRLEMAVEDAMAEFAVETILRVSSEAGPSSADKVLVMDMAKCMQLDESHLRSRADGHRLTSR